MTGPEVTGPGLSAIATPSYVAGLVKSGRVRPKRSLGQNFLVDRNVLSRVARAAGSLEGATVLEIGAGLGGLTLALAEAGASRVVSVEKDETLARILETTTAGEPGLEVVVGDALELDLRNIAGPEPLLVGNLPYSITTPLLLKVLEPPVFWPRAAVMVQLEVAQRILAPPGGKDYGALTLAIAAVARAELAFKVSRNCFYPRPDVDSAVLTLERRPPAGGLDAPGLLRLSSIVRAAFGQRRKMLANSVAAGLRLDRAQTAGLILEAGLDPQQRGEALALEDFLALERVFRPLLTRAESL